MSRLLAAIVLLYLASSVRADAQCMNIAANLGPFALDGYAVVSVFLQSCSSIYECVLCGTNDPSGFGSAASNQMHINQLAPYFEAHACWNGTYSNAPSGENVYSLPTKRDYIKLLSRARCNSSMLSCSDAYLSEPPCPSQVPCPPTSPSTESDGSLSKIGDKYLAVIIAAAAVGGFLLAEFILYLRVRFGKQSPYSQNVQPYHQSSNVQMYPQSSGNIQM